LLTTLVVRDQVKTIDSALKKSLDNPIVSDSSEVNLEKVLDSIKLDSVLAPLQEKGIPGINVEELKQLDSLVKRNTVKSKNIKPTFDFNTKKVDSLIAIKTPDNEIYMAMGMEKDAGYFTRKFYEQGLKFYKQRDGGQVIQAAYDTIPISLFILLPIFALILKLLFFKRGSYAYHLVFSFYFYSFLFTVFSIILIMNYFFDIPYWIDLLLVLSTFFYLFIGVKRFYKQGWFVSFFKTSLATFVYFSFVIPIALGLIFLIGFLFY
jgi:hypothetical protein